MGILLRSAGKIHLAIILQTPPRTDSWGWPRKRMDNEKELKEIISIAGFATGANRQCGASGAVCKC